MDRKLLGLFSLFFIMFAFFTILILGRNTIKRFTRADEDKLPNGTSSIILGWPVSPKVNSSSTITVFVRSATGKPVPDRIVAFSTTVGTIQTKSVASDGNGKAETVLDCNEAGIAQIGAVIDGTTPIEQKITIECVK